MRIICSLLAVGLVVALTATVIAADPPAPAKTPPPAKSPAKAPKAAKKPTAIKALHGVVAVVDKDSVTVRSGTAKKPIDKKFAVSDATKIEFPAKKEKGVKGKPVAKAGTRADLKKGDRIILASAKGDAADKITLLGPAPVKQAPKTTVKKTTPKPPAPTAKPPEKKP